MYIDVCNNIFFFFSSNLKQITYRVEDFTVHNRMLKKQVFILPLIRLIGRKSDTTGERSARKLTLNQFIVTTIPNEGNDDVDKYRQAKLTFSCPSKARIVYLLNNPDPRYSTGPTHAVQVATPTYIIKLCWLHYQDPIHLFHLATQLLQFPSEIPRPNEIEQSINAPNLYSTLYVRYAPDNQALQFEEVYILGCNYSTNFLPSVQ